MRNVRDDPNQNPYAQSGQPYQYTPAGEGFDPSQGTAQPQQTQQQPPTSYAQQAPYAQQPAQQPYAPIAQQTPMGMGTGGIGTYESPPQQTYAQQPAGGYQSQQVQAGTTPQQPVAQTQGATPPGQVGIAGAPPRLRPQFVEDIVQTDVSVASPDTSVQEVVAEMADRNVGSVVIVENDVPVGIVTDRSIALAVGQTRDVSKTAVGDLMTPDPVTATPDTSVFDAIDLMHDASVRRLPVVDDDGTLRGIVALDDVLVTFSAELDRATEIIEAQSPSR